MAETPASDTAAFEKALLAWVVEQGTNASANTEADYAQGLSGTKQDTIMEKAYGELLRGTTEGERLDSKNPFPRQECTCTLRPEDGSHGPDCEGRWLRTLNKNRTCYLYVHTITHEITGVRPSNFVDADEERQKRAAAALGDLPDFASCQPRDAFATAMAMYSTGKKLPLLLAGSEEGAVEATLKEFTAAGGIVFDTRPWVLPVAKTKVKFPDHVAAWTKTVKTAVKKGTPLLLEATEECPDFLGKLCTQAKYNKTFPEQVFNPVAKGWMKDLLLGNAPSDKFFITILTKLTPQDYEAELGTKLPMQFCEPLRVRSFVPARIVDVKDLKAEETGGVFEAANSAGMTLLLLDSTQDGVVDTFLMYQRTTAVDLPQILASDRSLEEVQELLRKQLVVAMKAGNKFLIRLRGSTPDFLGEICGDGSAFPIDVFSGIEVLRGKELQEKLFLEEEKEHGVTVCRDGFQVVVSSNALLENFAVELATSLPLRRCAVYLVEQS